VTSRDEFWLDPTALVQRRTAEIEHHSRGSTTVSQAAIAPIQPPDTIAVNLAAFLRSLPAEHKSEKTIETYRQAVVQLAAFLAGQRLPDEVRDLRREHIEAWMIELLGRSKPATVNNRENGGVLSAQADHRTLNRVGLSAPSVPRREVAMGIIAWIVLGAIAGWITNLIMGGKEGVIATIILGIIGAVVGGWLAGTVLKVADVTGVNVQSIVVAVIGAVIVVAVYRMVIGRRTAV
jgi:uncharacterized membrane protein YeaQ/YmgE (transglycosylase-associated protein family)